MLLCIRIYAYMHTSIYVYMYTCTYVKYICTYVHSYICIPGTHGIHSSNASIHQTQVPSKFESEACCRCWALFVAVPLKTPGFLERSPQKQHALQGPTILECWVPFSGHMGAQPVKNTTMFNDCCGASLACSACLELTAAVPSTLTL